MNESYEEKIKRLRPIDDDFFKIYIHPIEIVKVIVEAILHKDVIISHCQSEAVMKNISGRTVEFDLYAKTEDDIYINIEIEKNKDMLCMNTEDMYHPILRERARYFKETEGGKRIMCEIWDEVRNEGRIEQTNIIALNMLESGIEINTVIRCTGLTLEEVLKLKDNNMVLSS